MMDGVHGKLVENVSFSSFVSVDTKSTQSNSARVRWTEIMAVAYTTMTVL